MNIKQEVQDFYNRVGWQEISEGIYQNAAFEDLRLVAREYIHRCHMRVLRHLRQQGTYLLDAGSGPIQYPEYLEYSKNYSFRVCADISILALQEARKRIGGKGLFVVADVAHLPFKPASFEGVVSLHTIHHLPLEDHLTAYEELYRMLAPGCSAVIVNGWKNPPVERWAGLLRRVVDKFGFTKIVPQPDLHQAAPLPMPEQAGGKTFVSKYDAAWFKEEIGKRLPYEIWVWRSLSVGIMRTWIREGSLGRWILRVIYRLEELAPHFWGERGVYPLIVIKKLERS